MITKNMVSAKAGVDSTAMNGWWKTVLQLGAIVAVAAASFLFGALPYWAAKRLLYPASIEPPQYTPESVIDVARLPEQVNIEARDGKSLGGWFLPPPEGQHNPWPCVILVYGYGGFKEQMHGYAKLFHDAGFATLMFDMRGAGLRRGEAVTLGYRERWDLMDAVRYLQTRSDVDGDRIGVLGVSMGGATALMAAEDEPKIKAIIADSAFADIADMIKPGVAAFVGPRATFLARLIVFYAETLMGVKADELRPVVSTEKMGPRPLLIIHGENDELTTPESARKLFSAAHGPKEIWMVPDCGHGAAPAVVPDEYRERVTGFFKRYL